MSRYRRTVKSSAVCLLTYGGIANAFNLFPAVDPVGLASSLNITMGCLEALNETFDCDPDLMRMALNVDDYWWTSDNTTDLCIDADCLDAAGSWSQDVEDACDGEYIVVDGKLVEASSVADRYNEGLTLACTTDSSVGPDELVYCIPQSQDWVGQDIVRTNCVNGTCPAEDTRLANLYGNDILCSSCFITLLYNRLISPYLADTDHSDDLINQYLDVLDVCNATQTMPELVVAGYADYDTAPTPVFNTTGTADQTCTGQTIPASAGSAGCDATSLKYGVTTGDLQAVSDSDTCAFSTAICLPTACNLKQITSITTCDSLAAQFSTPQTNVTTTMFLGWNQNIIGLCTAVQASQYVCAAAPGGTYIPLPPNSTDSSEANQNRFGSSNDTSIISGNPSAGNGQSPGTGTGTGTGPSPTQDGIIKNCNTFQKAIDGDYCYEFAAANNITEAQLYEWNGVLGTSGQNCTNEFFSGYFYCTGVDSTQRSGPPPPDPHQDGIVLDCQAYAQAPNNSYCDLFAQNNNITTAQLSTWNTVLGNNGANCSNEFFSGYYYCTFAPDAAAGTPVVPSPTQPGIVSNCNAYAKAVSGDYCYLFAQNHNITTKQLYDWNSVLGPNGANCSTQFQLGENYCVGIEVPTPTQSGIATNCDLFAQATSGDYCYQFAKEHNITTDQLYEWNTVLGSGGSNCGNGFQAGEYYCISVANT